MSIVNFLFTETATTNICTLSLHDALPISSAPRPTLSLAPRKARSESQPMVSEPTARSEEHTSELQSRRDLVCRLLLEKKNTDRAAYRHILRQGLQHIAEQLEPLDVQQDFH